MLALANWSFVKQSPKSHKKIVLLTSTFGNTLIHLGLSLIFGCINEKIVRGRGEKVLKERSGLLVKYGTRKSHLTLEKPGSLVGKSERDLETTFKLKAAAKKAW